MAGKVAKRKFGSRLKMEHWKAQLISGCKPGSARKLGH